MKLHTSQIEMMSQSLAKMLVESGAADVESADAVVMRMSRLVIEDLQVEDRLNEEVREILSQHEFEMRSKGIQFHEMFKIVKQKLARERKLIL